MTNIAIVGKMYSGKTTLAEAFVQNHGYTRVAMAGPLKQLALLAYGENLLKDKEYEVIDLETGEAFVKSGRAILQGIGQTIKAVDRDIWLKVFINDTAQMAREPYVVDDVRFGFEADYLRSKGWKIVKVQTPEELRISRAKANTGRTPTKDELNHESESEVDDIKSHYIHFGDCKMRDVPVRAAEILRYITS